MSGAPLALIVNPVATRSGVRPRAAVTRALAPLGLEWSLVTAGPGEGARLALGAVAEGARTVVCMGGDGLASEVAAALADGPAALLPLPGGNANVLSRALGWSGRLDDALAAARSAILAGRPGRARLGRIAHDEGERVFAVNAGIGLDAGTVAWVEARPSLKRRLRHGAFAAGALAALAGSARTPPLEVVVDGAVAGSARGLIAACGRPYSLVGSRPLDLVAAGDFDGRIGWLALRSAGPLVLGRALGGALRGHPPQEGHGVLSGVTAGPIEVSCPLPVPLQADGEALGSRRRAVIGPGPSLLVFRPVNRP